METREERVCVCEGRWLKGERKRGSLGVFTTGHPEPAADNKRKQGVCGERTGRRPDGQFPALRDWSLITGTGGGLQNGKIEGPKLFAPPPSRQGKTFHAPPPPPF